MKSTSDGVHTSTADPGRNRSLLTEDEPPSYRVVNASGSSALVLVCDHASNRVPRRLQNLGLSTPDLGSHIALDLGAASVAVALSNILDAPLVLSNYSRLVIDCNRPLDSPESIPQQSGGVSIPGNLNLSENDRRMRQEGIFNPYQQAITQLLQQRSMSTALLSIHSFTPELNGEQRPWQIGVSYYRDARFARLLHQALQQSEAEQVTDKWLVGFNKPYAIETEFDYTVPMQGETRELPSAMIEIRQDEIGDDRAVQQWADRLATAWAVARNNFEG